MSEDTNKELEQVSVNNENFTEVVTEKIEDVKVEEPIVQEATQTVVEVPVQVEAAPVNPVVTQEVVQPAVETPITPEVTSETVIEADVNHEVEEATQNIVGTIEEVTVQVDSNAFNTLSESEVSENSIFNKKDEVVAGGMKEGQEHLNEKKGFPFFMIFALVLVIVIACNVDKIDGILQKIKEKQKEPETKEEEKKEKEEKVAKELTLSEIKTALDSSELVVDFEKRHTVELNVVVVDNKLVLTTTDYLNIEEIDSLVVDFVHANHILTATVEFNTTEFGKEMAILLIKEIGALQGMNSVELDNYLKDNLYTTTLDKGFELTNSEDGNNTYRIMTNVIFKID